MMSTPGWHFARVSRFRRWYALADVPHADDPEGLACQFEAPRGLVGKAPAFRREHDFPQPAGKREQQRKGVLGDGRLGVKRDVRDGHAAFPARGQVEVIGGRGARGDEAEPRMRGEKFAGDFPADERREDFRVVADLGERRDKAHVVPRQAAGVDFLIPGFRFDKVNDHGAKILDSDSRRNHTPVAQGDAQIVRTHFAG